MWFVLLPVLVQRFVLSPRFVLLLSTSVWPSVSKVWHIKAGVNTFRFLQSDMFSLVFIMHSMLVVMATRIVGKSDKHSPRLTELKWQPDDLDLSSRRLLWLLMYFCQLGWDLIEDWTTFQLTCMTTWMCLLCHGYCRRKWMRRREFKSWTRLFAFHITLIHTRKVWIQFFVLQQWVASQANWILYLCFEKPV